jgi:hypothetical protein
MFLGTLVWHQSNIIQQRNVLIPNIVWLQKFLCRAEKSMLLLAFCLQYVPQAVCCLFQFHVMVLLLMLTTQWHRGQGSCMILDVYINNWSMQSHFLLSCPHVTALQKSPTTLNEDNTWESNDEFWGVTQLNIAVMERKDWSKCWSKRVHKKIGVNQKYMPFSLTVIHIVAFPT